jgi:hypothetical protein
METGPTLVAGSAATDAEWALCRDWCQALASALGRAVELRAGAPAAGGVEGRDAETFDPAPAPSAAAMGAAPFVWRADGRPDWGAMWTTFCDLALHGGPPHRGEDAPLRAPAAPAPTDPRTEAIAEIRRGVWETTGLFAEPAGPGWIAVTCDSPRMAAWLCATILLENVEARCDEERLLLPADPSFRLKEEVKSVVTVLAKTAHYWQAHVAGG